MLTPNPIIFAPKNSIKIDQISQNYAMGLIETTKSGSKFKMIFKISYSYVCWVLNFFNFFFFLVKFL